jgi:hypothetical protein
MRSGGPQPVWSSKEQAPARHERFRSKTGIIREEESMMLRRRLEIRQQDRDDSVGAKRGLVEEA